MLSRILLRCTTCDRETVVVSSGGRDGFKRALKRAGWSAGTPIPGSAVGSRYGSCPAHGGA